MKLFLDNRIENRYTLVVVTASSVTLTFQMVIYQLKKVVDSETTTWYDIKVADNEATNIGTP
ncbi:hypothetical protein [Marinilactibacillus piezotolerans]|uniref:hypothetical protein n=1 Tax=Marinilactibacillus piezotolerans TaxID=258723 RepID=UPI0009AFBE54|nr:hypothetical protein [Marinilactibacillus piezotolerans]